MNSILKYFVLLFLLLSSCSNGKPSKDSPQQKHEELEDLIELGDLYYQLQKHAEALNVFNKIIALDSTRGEFFYKRAYCRAWLLDFDGSTQDYLNSIELDHRIEDSYFSIGLNYSALLEDSMAIKFFYKVLELDPNYEKAKNGIIRCKLRLGIIEI